MPRPASALWSHFRRDGPNKRAVCKYCQHNMCGLVTRMRAHLARKCPECPIAIKTEMFEADLNRKMELSMVADGRAAGAPGAGNAVVGASAPGAGVGPGAATSGPGNAGGLLPSPHGGAGNGAAGGGGGPLKKARRGRAPASTSTAAAPPGVHPATGLDDKTELDSYVAKTIFGGGVPVSLVEHPAFVRLLKRLGPGYEVPTADVLTHSLLDEEFTYAQLKLRAEVLDATSVCLGVESWASTMGRSLISCVIHTPTPGVFSFESTGEVPHTADVLALKIEQVMTQIGTGKVSAIVLDLQDPEMKRAALILKSKFPSTTFLPSCAHAMEAMVTDILAIPEIARSIGLCREVARYVARNHIARAAFARISEPMRVVEASYPLHEPADGSPLTSLECLIGIERNHHSFQILLAEDGPMNELEAHAKEQIINLAFWDEVKTYAALLEPFLDMLKTFDSDYPLLSTFYHRLTQLFGHVQTCGGIASKVQQVMSEHWSVLRHPAMFTAHVLDPRYQGSGGADLGNEELEYLKSYVDPALASHLVAELSRYTGRTGMFADDAVWESAQKCSPIHWWKGFIGGSVPHLQAVALRNVCFPASSGLSKSRREMFEKLHQMNSKCMNEETANKVALVYLNANMSASEDVGLSNETLV